jgi:hypothetical protein
VEAPSLADNQFAVGKAQYSTGIVLRNDGTFYSVGQDLSEAYEIFEDYETAEKFALQKILDNPNVECWIVNSKGEHMITYDTNGKRLYK